MKNECLENILLSAGEETYRHSRNVESITAILCANTAVEQLYSPTEICAIVEAARYHDIGKSQIDKSILYSTGKLSKEEFDVIKQHPTLGKNIVDDVLGDVLDKTANVENTIIMSNVALYHHQRADGSGYPPVQDVGAIPTYAEIVAIADIMEAITAKRSYKEPMPIAQAYSMIMNGECGTFTAFAKNLLSESIDEIGAFIEAERREPTIYPAELFEQNEHNADIFER